jgi:rSAM/selenodomain-associated transferase 2/rSAM/selenodomain-associated transferase 1
MAGEMLILFTRFPLPGRVKTRLIPHLGPEGAAQLQREMTEHVLARIYPLMRRRGVKLVVRFDGGSKQEMRRWLGDGFDFVPQGEGDLGTRMCRAAAEAFAVGARAVVMIGADCPELDAAQVERALEALEEHSLVFGPAKDGGYYLIGLRTGLPQLFESIAWGTPEVLATSLTRARQMNLEPILLGELSDVDAPADLETWQKARRMARTFSVVIPTLNEAEHLPLTLTHAAGGQPLEIIVADGGSRDGTLTIAQSCGARVVTSNGNRAGQMNLGAQAAHGETLLFLHGDTLLPANYSDVLFDGLRKPQVVGGAFAFRIRDRFRGRRLVESLTNLRSRIWHMPYGDQALFVRRWAFAELGGFPEQPIMEDYEFVRRLRQVGKLAILHEAVLTSGRRWQRLGFFRTTLINQLVILGYRCGVPPAKLAALYRLPRAPGDRSSVMGTGLEAP